MKTKAVIIPPRIGLVISLTVFLVLIYQLIRGMFLVTNIDSFSAVETGELVYAFLHGTRFDIYSVLWLSVPLFLVVIFLPDQLQLRPWFKKLSVAYLFLIHCFFIGFNVVDTELVNFSGKRTTMDIFFLAEDIGGMGFDIISFYWFQTLLGLGIFTVVYLGIRTLMAHFQKCLSREKTGLAKQIGVGIVIVAMLIVGMRGGLQLKPIRPVTAFLDVSQASGVLVLNTTFTMLRSKRSGSMKKVDYFADRQTLQDLLSRPLKDTKYYADFRGFNVVLIIMESFSLEYTGFSGENHPSYTPFLDSLAEDARSRVFVNHFANGRRSIDAVPSLLAGIPSLMTEPFISSNYQTNRILGWGETLSNLGYSTQFFHGAQNGSMFFDSFSRQAGFQEYFGLNEYPEASIHNDGSWGIYDEPFFLYAVKQLSVSKKPFAAVLFSLSSHHPYKVPEQYDKSFPEGTLDIHKSIGYADHSLKVFFEAASQQPWFNSTVFFITADHTSKTEHPSSQTIYGTHRVPLLVFSPKKDLPAFPGEVFTQHIDVPKTIYSLLGVRPNWQTEFGVDIFALREKNGFRGEVFNFSYPGYWFLDSSGLYRFDDAGQKISMESVEGWHSLQTAENTEQKAPAVMRAWLQYYVNGLISNSWFEKTKK